METRVQSRPRRARLLLGGFRSARLARRARLRRFLGSARLANDALGARLGVAHQLSGGVPRARELIALPRVQRGSVPRVQRAQTRLVRCADVRQLRLRASRLVPPRASRLRGRLVQAREHPRRRGGDVGARRVRVDGGGARASAGARAREPRARPAPGRRPIVHLAVVARTVPARVQHVAHGVRETSARGGARDVARNQTQRGFFARRVAPGTRGVHLRGVHASRSPLLRGPIYGRKRDSSRREKETLRRPTVRTSFLTMSLQVDT